MTYLTYIGTSRENTGNGPAKKVLKSFAVLAFMLIFMLTTNNTVTNGNHHYINSHYISAAGGSTHWVQCSSLLTASGIFISRLSLKSNEI